MLRPNGLAPARLHRLAKVASGVPFASPARESRRALLDCHRANPPGHDIQRLRRAGDGGGNSPLRGSRGEIGLRGSRGNTRARSFPPFTALIFCCSCKVLAIALFPFAHLSASREMLFLGKIQKSAHSRYLPMFAICPAWRDWLSMRRFTRLTNAFSKKLENHEAAIALHYMHYNFARIHQSLRVTPAMAAGVSDRVWSLEEIVSLMDSSLAK